MSANIKTTFTITCEIKGDEHTLIVKPSERCEYGEVRMPITKDQWNTLRFGFATGRDDSNKAQIETIALVYIK